MMEHERHHGWAMDVVNSERIWHGQWCTCRLVGALDAGRIGPWTSS